MPSAAVYLAVLDELLGPPPSPRDGNGGGGDDPPLRLYVESIGEGFEIALDVQAQVVQGLAERADVTFIDERAEAIDTTLPDSPVKHDGLLVGLGPLVARNEAHLLQVVRYVSEDDEEALEAEVVPVPDGWEAHVRPVP